MPPRIQIRTGVDPKVVAKLPKLTLKAWRALVKKKPRIVTEQTKADTRKAHEEAAKKNNAGLAEVYQSLPARLKFLDLGNKCDPAPGIRFRDEIGKPHRVRTLNRDSMVHDALVAHALMSSAVNKAKIYSCAVSAIQKHAKKKPELQSALKKLPKSFNPKKVTAEEIDRGITSLVAAAQPFFTEHLYMSEPTGSRPDTCGQEEGTGNGGDSTGVDFTKSRSTLGLLRNNDWPLKPFTTCIRNQAVRGTCPSFATVAAMEAFIAAEKNRWVNLSEQDLYKKMRHDWFPVDDYSDGFAPPVSLLYQLLTGYQFPWERQWDYNPSWQREDDEADRTYSHSCDDYDNVHCSDTNHQSRETCYQLEEEVQTTIIRVVSTWVERTVTVVEDVVNFLGMLVGQETHVEVWGEWVEETVTDIITDLVSTEVCVFDTDIRGSSGFGVDGVSVFWTPGQSDAEGILLTQLFVYFKVPVIYCLWAMPSFTDCATNGGYVFYPGPNEAPADGEQITDTGHCVCITGFVQNEDLPDGVFPGAGGGYFIVKNSWGTDFGDCGFAYVPYDWVTQWGQVMCAITSITP